MHLILLFPVMLIEFIFTVAFVAAFFEVCGEKFNANKKSYDYCDYDYYD
jgi:hypothetical protein